VGDERSVAFSFLLNQAAAVSRLSAEQRSAHTKTTGREKWGGGEGGLEDQIDRGRLGRAQWAGKLVVVMVVAAVMAVGGG
jgi:hypothetical protein